MIIWIFMSGSKVSIIDRFHMLKLLYSLNFLRFTQIEFFHRFVKELSAYKFMILLTRQCK